MYNKIKWYTLNTGWKGDAKRLGKPRYQLKSIQTALVFYFSLFITCNPARVGGNREYRKKDRFVLKLKRDILCLILASEIFLHNNAPALITKIAFIVVQLFTK